MNKNNKKIADVTEHQTYRNRFGILYILKIAMIFLAAMLFTFLTIIAVVNVIRPVVGLCDFCAVLSG